MKRRTFLVLSLIFLIILQAESVCSVEGPFYYSSDLIAGTKLRWEVLQGYETRDDDWQHYVTGDIIEVEILKDINDADFNEAEDLVFRVNDNNISNPFIIGIYRFIQPILLYPWGENISLYEFYQNSTADSQATTLTKKRGNIIIIEEFRTGQLVEGIGHIRVFYYDETIIDEKTGIVEKLYWYEEYSFENSTIFKVKDLTEIVFLDGIDVAEFDYLGGLLLVLAIIPILRKKRKTNLPKN
ncbi:MAG: hypothetical protein GPJ51_12470 [Candidatus Heimdallarchaeota archaeon]|nr:hypothetical protein [Candidatus Heimdallarchaeota archaeon]